ncbi:hypothetical protein LXA43DRAFT_208873 [Ganoderma leucocontextum]|nr:hypothetical protein LXA43DRAFT_208873 [Ganoderma leucocontextum]
MISKARPIVHDHVHWHAALLGLTVKFDQAQLDSSFKSIRPPSAPSELQIGKTTLNVDSETMPSVGCSRSACPIASVGLYVPGGRGLQSDGARDPGASGRKGPIYRGIYVTKLVGASPSSSSRQAASRLWARPPTAPRPFRMSTISSPRTDSEVADAARYVWGGGRCITPLSVWQSVKPSTLVHPLLNLLAKSYHCVSAGVQKVHELDPHAYQFHVVAVSTPRMYVIHSYRSVWEDSGFPWTSHRRFQIRKNCSPNQPQTAQALNRRGHSTAALRDSPDR